MGRDLPRVESPLNCYRVLDLTDEEGFLCGRIPGLSDEEFAGLMEQGVFD